MAIDQFSTPSERDAFGHWLSGFVDGEGHFCLHRCKHKMAHGGKTLGASLAISVRLDDQEILREIGRYWGVGTFNFPTPINGNHAIRFQVASFRDLYLVVVPHFERYPLRAKKQRDFEIWKKGVEIMYRVKCRPPVSNGRRFFPKATDTERDEFQVLVDLLQKQRRYTTTDALEIPKRGARLDIQGDLFT
jgi:hypothetical protein